MPDRTRRLALLGCLLLAVCLRTVRLLERPLIHPDGPAYIEVARALDAAHWPAALAGYYPPGYPAALRAAHAAGLDWETAGRAVALTAGSLTVPLTGVLGGAILGPEVGVGAALLAAVHPRMIRASAEVLPETLYGLFVVLWALLLIGSPVPVGRLAAAAGVAALAYLVRVEGLVLVPLTAFAAWAGAAAGSRLRRIAVAATVAAVVLVPVVVTVWRETGVWMVSGKEMPIVARQYGVEGSGLLALGVRHPAALLATGPRLLARHAGYTLGVMHLLLLAPIVLGLATAPRDAAARQARRLALLTLAVSTLAIGLVNPGKRYVVPLVPLLLPWGALGARRLRALASDGSLGRVVAAVARRAPAIAAVAVAALAFSGLRPPDRTEEGCFRSVCVWVAERFGSPPPPIVTEDGRIAYLCGARFVLEPRRGGAAAVARRGRAVGGGLWIVKRWRRTEPVLADGIVPVGERCGKMVAIFQIRAP